MNGKLWTDEQIDYLEANYETMANGEIASHLGLTVLAVSVKACRLGLRKPQLAYGGTDKRKLYRDRYRAKCIAKGCCPHCGKPCSPHSYCNEVLEKKRLAKSDGKPRRISKTKHITHTPTGTLTRVGNVTVHRMAI